MTAALAMPPTSRPTPLFEDCYFYRSITLPRHVEVEGERDLRGREKEYLGRVEGAWLTASSWESRTDLATWRFDGS
jgi:hypothetical protein